jgi:putative peptidoglycan lipid II flippase
MAWVSLYVLLASIARAAREMVIAYRYGVGPEVDAYLFIFNLVNWPIGVWSSVLTVVLVPLAARINREALADLPRFRSELLGVALIVGITLALLAMIGLPWLLGSSLTGLPGTTLPIAKAMVPVLAFLAPLGILIALLAAWTLASGRHVSTLLEGVPSIVLTLALITFAGGGIEPLLWGTLVGVAFHVAALAAPFARRGEIEWPRFSRQSPQWPAFWQGFSIVVAGQALMSLVAIADQFFAAHLGVGAIATLGYANRILALALGLGAIAVSRGSLPVFSRAHADGATHAHRIATQWMRLLLGLGGVCMIVGWWLAPWVVELLFERGAFTPNDTVNVTKVLRYGLVQLPFFFAALVLTSYLSSRRMYIWLFWSGALGLCTKLAGNALLAPILGVPGIALATAVTYAINFSLFWIVFRSLRQQA